MTTLLPSGCSVATRGNIRLTKNKTEQQPSVKKRFVCEVCGSELSSRQQLVAHTYRHTGDLPYKCDASGCAMAFPRKASLDR